MADSHNITNMTKNCALMHLLRSFYTASTQLLVLPHGPTFPAAGPVASSEKHLAFPVTLYSRATASLSPDRRSGIEAREMSSSELDAESGEIGSEGCTAGGGGIMGPWGILLQASRMGQAGRG